MRVLIAYKYHISASIYFKEILNILTKLLIFTNTQQNLKHEWSVTTAPNKKSASLVSADQIKYFCIKQKYSLFILDNKNLL